MCPQPRAALDTHWNRCDVRRSRVECLENADHMLLSGITDVCDSDGIQCRCALGMFILQRTDLFCDKHKLYTNHHAVYFKYLLALLVIYTSTNGFPGSSDIKNLPARRDTKFLFLGLQDPLEEGMAAHSSILPWRSPWTEGPGGLQSIALQSPTGLSRNTSAAQ
ncbi:unnamed protein product [Rangifer tarandus platyrhynchus]|uniref:Uncharacterized protein n=1 Tax=Rangifer tarandus platyrhynchus TaxID=3082113 RepID=A0ACB1MJZ3_RANTA